ncbi:hypothetical protein C0J52_24244 [Blattella germanica]|nr:hypothetical protein C0J52_24244 [Blattella germanica]
MEGHSEPGPSKLTSPVKKHVRGKGLTSGEKIQIIEVQEERNTLCQGFVSVTNTDSLTRPVPKEAIISDIFAHSSCSSKGLRMDKDPPLSLPGPEPEPVDTVSALPLLEEEDLLVTTSSPSSPLPTLPLDPAVLSYTFFNRRNVFGRSAGDDRDPLSGPGVVEPLNRPLKEIENLVQSRAVEFPLIQIFSKKRHYNKAAFQITYTFHCIETAESTYSSSLLTSTIEVLPSRNGCRQHIVIYHYHHHYDQDLFLLVVDNKRLKFYTEFVWNCTSRTNYKTMLPF